jgi:hypothetical protein
MHDAAKWSDQCEEWPYRAHLTKSNGQIKVARIPTPFIELRLEDGRMFALDPNYDGKNTLVIYRESGAWLVRPEHFFRQDQPATKPATEPQEGLL